MRTVAARAVKWRRAGQQLCLRGRHGHRIPVTALLTIAEGIRSSFRAISGPSGMFLISLVGRSYGAALGGRPGNYATFDEDGTPGRSVLYDHIPKAGTQIGPVRVPQ